MSNKIHLQMPNGNTYTTDNPMEARRLIAQGFKPLAVTDVKVTTPKGEKRS